MPGIFNKFIKTRKQQVEKKYTIDPNYSFYTGHLVNLPMPDILSRLEQLGEEKIQLRQPFFCDVGDAKHIYFYDESVGIRFWDLWDNRNPTAQIEIKGRPWYWDDKDKILQSENPDLYNRVSKLFDKYCELYCKNIGMNYSGMSWLQIGYTLSGMLSWLNIQPEILQTPQNDIIAVSFVIDDTFRLSYDTTSGYGMKILDPSIKSRYPIRSSTYQDPKFDRIVNISNEANSLLDEISYGVAQQGIFRELFEQVVKRTLVYENKINPQELYKKQGLLAMCEKQKKLALQQTQSNYLSPRN